MAIYLYENEFLRVFPLATDENTDEKYHQLFGRVPSIGGDMIWWTIGRICFFEDRWMWKSNDLYLAPQIILEVADLLVKLDCKEIVL